MKRCSSQQYIPPTRRLINMKNRKLKWQQEAAEKDRQRESLLRMKPFSSSTTFQVQANSSMWMSPDYYGSNELNSSGFIEKSYSSFLNSPVTSKPGVRYVNNQDEESEVAKRQEQEEQEEEEEKEKAEEVKEIKRSQSNTSIHSSPQKLDRYSANSVLSPLHVSQKINTPQPFTSHENIDTTKQLISKVKIGNYAQGTVKKSSLFAPSSILSRASSTNATSTTTKAAKKQRSEKDNNMIKTLMQKRRLKLEELSREKNLAQKEKYIKDQLVGSQSVVQQQQNENNEQSPTKLFLAGKQMKKKRSIASISLTTSTGNFESQESSSYQVNEDSPGTWADKKLKQDQKRIMKAMTMLQTRK